MEPAIAHRQQDDDEADAAAGGGGGTTAQTTMATTAASAALTLTTATKRQHRRQLQSSNKNRDGQFPKIQNSEQRNRAYLRNAGLLTASTSSPTTTSSTSASPSTGGTKDNKKKERPSPPQDTNDVDILSTGQQHFGRLLGGPDARIRHRTVLQLEHYLKTSASSNTGTGLSELDLLKLWKCLWYTLYMSDRQVVQDELSKILCQKLLWSLAGTPEQDEYAACTYMQICFPEETSGSGGEEGHLLLDEQAVDHENEKQEEDEPDVILMEEIENTLDNQMEEQKHSDQQQYEDDDDDDEDSDAVSSKNDHQEKQLALLEEQDQSSSSTTNNDDDNMSEEEEEAENLRNQDADVEDEDDEMLLMKHCCGVHLVSLFVRTFFRTIVREWSNMDKYRVDKFYTCIRYMMSEIYKYMSQRYWNIGIIRLFNDAIFDEVLSQTPNGPRYHILDICLEELVKVNETSAPIPLTEVTFLDVMEPFFAMAQTGGPGGDDTIHNRVVEHVLQSFLHKYSVYNNRTASSVNDDDDGDDDGNNNNDGEGQMEDSDDDDGTSYCPIFDQVHVGTIAEFIFQIASDEDTPDNYRKNLYNVHKEYVRRIHELGEDKDVDISREGYDEEEEWEGAGGDDNDKDGSEDEEKAVEEASADAKAEVEERQKEEADPPEEKTQKQEAKSEVTSNSEERQEQHSESTGNKKKRKKKKKRKEKKEEPAPAPEVQKEEEVTISFAEQKAAKRAIKTKSAPDKKRKQESSSPDEQGSDKKVKFGETNIARSWKKSMKNLRELETPISGMTPERSILLNKDESVQKKTKKKKKKGGH